VRQKFCASSNNNNNNNNMELLLENQTLLLVLLHIKLHRFQKLKVIPARYYKLARTGRGMGRGRIKRTKRVTKSPIDLFSILPPSRFKDMIHMTIDEFVELKDEIIESCFERFDLTKIKCLTYNNKILMIFMWVVHYPRYALLAALFGVSVRTVSVNISEMIIILSEFFINFIPDGKINNAHSAMSTKICYIVDGTIHPIRKPSQAQWKWFNAHYGTHGIISQILCDYSGLIISLLTNIKGHTHDFLSATYNENFRRIVGNDFSLGDPGFQSVDWVVAGFRPSQVKSLGKQIFDKQSRKEQIIIEHVNCFIKKCATLSRENKFIHGHDKLIACVISVCGWYNYKKLNGHYFPMD